MIILLYLLLGYEGSYPVRPDVAFYLASEIFAEFVAVSLLSAIEIWRIARGRR